MGRATSAAFSAYTRPATRFRGSPTSRCTRSSTAARSRPASRPPTAAGRSSRAASWGWSARCSARTTCARSRGELAIGHVRYSTTGSNAWENSQPVQRSEGTHGSHRELALAHNGNLINAVELHGELLERGVTFSSTSDSEIIAALIATHPAEQIEDAIADVLPRLRGAFSIVAMTKDRVLAFRDPHGLRPLALGALGRPRPSTRPGRGRDADTHEAATGEAPMPRRRSTGPAVRLLRGQRVVRVRHHRRPPPARRAARRAGEHRRGRRAQPPGGGGRAQGVLRVRVHLLRPPRLAHERPGAAGRARAHGRDPVARGARRGRPRDRRPRLRQPRRPRPRSRRRAAPGRRLRQEPLRRAHLHPARPGAAQARAAPEVQPAPRGDRRIGG